MLPHSTLFLPRGCLLLTALLGLFILLPDPASAQDRKPVHYITISGDSDDNTCYYQIEGQDDQDLFRIEPRGALIFNSSADFDVEATIEPNAEGTAGVAGAASQNRFEVTARGVTPVAVRRAMGKDSEHKVRIQCCTDKGFFGGCKWTPAEPIPSEVQQMGYAPRSTAPRPMKPHAAQTIPAPHGPSAPSILPDLVRDASPPRPPAETGGPVMKVEEDA
jgi:hypothetical protein